MGLTRTILSLYLSNFSVKVTVSAKKIAPLIKMDAVLHGRAVMLFLGVFSSFLHGKVSNEPLF
jgi:hypothetical protein